MGTRKVYATVDASVRIPVNVRRKICIVLDEGENVFEAIKEAVRGERDLEDASPTELLDKKSVLTDIETLFSECLDYRDMPAFIVHNIDITDSK